MWDCQRSVIGFIRELGGVDMNPETCPELSTCSKIRVARLTHARPCCRSAEPLESICARCEKERREKEDGALYAALAANLIAQWN